MKGKRTFIICGITVLFFACGTQKHIIEYPILPGETAEHAAYRELASFLSSSEGQAMKGEQLAILKRGHIDIGLPQDTNNREPQHGIFYGSNSSSSDIEFLLNDNSDNIGTIGKAEFHRRKPEFQQDTVITYQLQSRGNGIYTLYNRQGVGNKRHPEGILQWDGIIIYVKNREHILISQGKQSTTAEYKLLLKY